MSGGPGGHPEPLDELTVAVRDLIGASRELTGRMAHLADRNATDMAAVGMLILFGPMGAGELARRLAITTAAATALIDRLERAGHAVRVRDTRDRRRVTIRETDVARAANLALWGPVIADIDRACRAVPTPERAAALRLLHDVTAAVERGGRTSPGQN